MGGWERDWIMSGLRRGAQVFAPWLVGEVRGTQSIVRIGFVSGKGS